ncbi:ABC transporter permease [Candidatus Dependentiae bacterium]
MSATLFFKLLYVELIPFLEIFKKRFIDTSAWILSRALVYVFLFPVIGAPVEFVGIFFAGAAFTGMMFEFVGTTVHLVDDIEGVGLVNYELSIPISQKLILVKMLVAHTVRALSIAVISVLIAKIAMWNAFDLSEMSLFLLIVALLCMGFFSGAFTLLVSSRLHDVSDISFMWKSWVSPLFLAGGNLFPWRAAVTAFPKFGWIFLINPFMHANELIRASLLGQEGYFPFWYSFLILTAFSFLLMCGAFRSFKKRLDLL